MGLKSIFNWMPEGIAKKIKLVRDRIVRRPLIKEIQKLPIVESGMSDDDFPWITLSNGYKFYGFLTLPDDRILYGYLGEQLKQKLIEDAFGVAIDIVTRYIYPHAQPTETPPYSLFERRAFHPQHEDTIKDIPNISSQLRKQLFDLFTVKEGETFVDIGAFLGYGALKVANLVKSSGKVISVEADPNCKILLEKNVKENSPGNILIVHRAVWNKKEKMSFYRTKRQANSLIQELIEGDIAADIVHADTVDNILSGLGIANVSLISLTVNGAEIEAVEGMSETLDKYAPRLSIAGWYLRDGKPIWKHVVPLLNRRGYKTVVGKKGRVYAWKDGN